MKINLLILSFIFSFYNFFCNSENLYFDQNGDFKILQVSDAHFKNGEHSECENYIGKCNSLKTIDFLKKALDFENPDLVIFSGDLIDGGSDNAKWSLDTLLNNVVNQNYKFAIVLGNHDNESTLTSNEVVEYVCSKKGGLCNLGPNNVYGNGNYI